MTRPLSIFLMALYVPAIAMGDDKAKAAKPLEQQLVETYTTWRKAMLDADYPTWKLHTARYRQAVTRNNIVSQKLKFPDALFTVPMKPASIADLKPIQARAVGITGQLVYYGKIDVGIELPEGTTLPENLLILKFIREGKTWKFNTLSLLNLSGAKDIKRQIARKDFNFLEHGNFVPPGYVPFPPDPCPTPAYVAQIQVTSFGYETEILINGISTHKISDTALSGLIIGGLKTTPNSVAIRSKPIVRPKNEDENPEDKDIPKKLEISVFAMPNEKGGRPHESWHYEPSKVLPSYRGIFFAMPR